MTIVNSMTKNDSQEIHFVNFPWKWKGGKISYLEETMEGSSLILSFLLAVLLKTSTCFLVQIVFVGSLCF